MTRHDLIGPCDAPDRQGHRQGAQQGPAFRVRPCRHPPRRRVCCRVLHLVGELDLAATPSLLVMTGSVLARPSRGLVLDLGGLTFCDAAGLTGLLRAARMAEAAGVPVSLTAPPRTVVRILGLCGLQRTFRLHPTTGNRRSSR